MLQRLSIVKALLVNPAVIIADEPTTGIDEEGRKIIVKALKEINEKNGIAIVFISHDIEMIKFLSPSEIYVFYGGTIIEKSKGFFNLQYHPYSKDLLKSSPEFWKKGKKLEVKEGFVPLPETKQKGCPYKERCDYKKKICEEEFPYEIKMNGSIVRCFLYSQ